MANKQTQSKRSTNDEKRIPHKSGIRRSSVQGLIVFLTTLFLAISLIGSGLFVCCAPFTTESLSKAFSRWEGSPFTQQELTEAALATRDYTVDRHSREDIVGLLYKINLSAQENNRANLPGAPDLSEITDLLDTDDLSARLSKASDRYVLTDTALSHLDDVFYVVDTARFVLISLGILALIGCIIIGKTAGRRRLGATLMAAACLVIALFIALAVWVIIDFNGFFTFLHSLFFAQGTWTFDIDSLLIRMYPTEFWIGMGAIWLATTVLMCVVCLILGLSIKGKKRV